MITILGPTASGKTTLACHLAHRMGGAEIISADSRMVYQGMTIGTGKDLDDYVVEGREIPYHLINIARAGERFNVYEFQRAFEEAYRAITARGNVPILCGGTGLYIESILKGYELGEESRPPRTSLTIGVMIGRQERRRKITQRLKDRLEEGMVDEVRQLLTYVPAERLLRYGLEYKYVTLYCLGQLTYDGMFGQLETAIHQFAKRQMTWFHGMEERRGLPIHWVDAAWTMEDKINHIITLWNAGE